MMISYNSNKIITDVYKIIVEQSNKEFFFNKIKIKPVFESRIEIFQLNLIIILWFFGIKNYNKKLTKGLVDFFINDLESAIREMGVSDTSIGRKTRTLVENFYGRLYSYSELFKAESVSKSELTAKFKKNFKSKSISYNYLVKYTLKNICYLKKLKIKDSKTINITFKDI
ncbi:MAG: hypothetical protein CMN01_00685 [Rickettsiales bacterium]|nr:hypothetical protein [Rickettsiales bacterium]